MRSVLSYMNPLNVYQYQYKAFSKGQNNDKLRQEAQYEIINFEFVSNDYQPIYERWNKYDEKEYKYAQELTLDDIEDIYLGSYDQLTQTIIEEQNLVDYVLQEDDTLYGLQIKFNITQNRILKINDISPDCLLPGMKIKVPKRNEIQQQEQEQVKNESYFGRNTMDEIMNKGTSKKFTVFYITQVGSIEGTITINQDILLFDPEINDYNQNLALQQKKQSILQFQACIMNDDILIADLIDLPNRISRNKNRCFKDYLIKIYLKQSAKFKKLKIDQPIQPVVTFRISNEDPKQFLQKSQEFHESILDILKDKLDHNEQLEQKDTDFTVIPYYDIESEELYEQYLIRTNFIWGGQEFIPQMMSQSSILSSDEFIEIVAHIPSLFKTCNWQLVFSNIIHGSSYHTLLNNCQGKNPLILVIKDLKDHKFGAYLSEEPKLSFGKFYGNGETYLWTFNDDEFHTFRWTEKNNDFQYCEQDGIAVGCGDKFGIYINNSLLYGYSQKCDTFDNPPLSSEGDFNIKVIEIWGLSD